MGEGFLGFGEKNPSYFKSCGDDCPVENVSWNDVQEYIKKLCELEKMNPCKYRLPTEAEWEYACRAGTNTSYFFGTDSKQLNDYAWLIDNSEEKYQKLAQKKPNPGGLDDMLGNLLEWTLDHYDEKLFTNLPDNAVDPIAPPKALVKYPKTLRGGSFEETAFELRSATRFHSDPTWNKRDPQIPKSKWWLTEARGVGIRLVRPIKQPSETEANQFFKNYLGL
jgi:formylglycine-generating enzyme required for sulfatase activity